MVTFSEPSQHFNDDQCPVCKTPLSWAPHLKFLVNPECYHKMCEDCVERHFSAGPRLCLIPGCTQTLRRNKFREPTFADLAVEREVDIRKRVAKV